MHAMDESAAACVCWYHEDRAWSWGKHHVCCTCIRRVHHLEVHTVLRDGRASQGHELPSNTVHIDGYFRVFDWAQPAILQRDFDAIPLEVHRSQRTTRPLLTAVCDRYKRHTHLERTDEPRGQLRKCDAQMLEFHFNRLGYPSAKYCSICCGTCLSST